VNLAGMVRDCKKNAADERFGSGVAAGFRFAVESSSRKIHGAGPMYYSMNRLSGQPTRKSMTTSWLEGRRGIDARREPDAQRSVVQRGSETLPVRREGEPVDLFDFLR